MALPLPSESELENRIYNTLYNNTDITANMDASVVGMLCKVMAREFSLIYQELGQIRSDVDISTMSGAALDNTGARFGIARRQAARATSLGQNRAIRFTNIGSAPYTMTTGVRVWKDSNPQVAYFTVEGATIPAGQSIDVHVKAVQEGSSYNANINEINRHNLQTTTITVTNVLPLDNGEFQESDDSYRERIVRAFQRRTALTVDNTVALLRGVAGVKDVVVINLRRGTGTFDAIVIPYNSSSTPQVIAQCENLLSQNVLVGVDYKVMGPKFRNLDLQIQLAFTNDNSARRESIREALRAQLYARVDNLPVEDGSGIGSLFLDQLQGLAETVDISVKAAMMRVGLDGTPLASKGEVQLGIGERIILRSLEIT